MKCTRKLGLCQPARYQIEVVGHLKSQKATWFRCLTLANEYGEDGTPITVMAGEVLDQAMLHGLLAKIRDLGLPLLAVNRIKSNEEVNKMSDEQNTAQEKCCAPSEGMPFAAMIEKIVGQQRQGCGCIAPGVMSQMMEQPGEACPCIDMIPNGTDQAETSSECSGMPSQMMGACCGSQVETETGPQTA